MKPNRLSALILITSISVFFCCCSQNNDTKEEVNLWPAIEPFQTGFMKVSETHEIYYELCGNPEGKPVFAIHGGPGSGCTPEYRQYFNPDKFLIVLHDQRGCGRSMPVNELKENNTQNLVEDIEQLRRKLNLDKILLVGGSWGTTLSLAYAEAYPENVSGMVLKGVFLGRGEDLDNFMFNIIPKFFPISNEALVEAISADSLSLSANNLLCLLQSQDPHIREKYAILYSRNEYKAAILHMKDEVLDEYFGSEENIEDIYTNALMEIYYVSNNCFLEEDQLLQEAHKIKHIPTTIINGRYDIICPPYAAYQLHKKLPESKLIIVEKAGHSVRDKPNMIEWLQAIRDFEK